MTPIAGIAIPIFLNVHVSVVIVSIIGAVIGLLFYFIFAWRNIKFSAKVAQASTRIILKYMGVVILMITVLVSIAIILEYCYLVATKNSKEFAAGNVILGIALFFSLFWTMFALLYFMRVFISSFVCLEILTYSHVSSILMEALSNTFYALGSIMFGAMLIAIVQTLRMLVSRDEERSDSILNSILYFLLSMLEDVIRFANEWVFVHIALYGKSYVKTLKTSFQELMSGKGSILVNSLCIMSAINLLSFACGLLYLGILYLTIDLAKTMNDIKEIMMLIMIMLTLFMFLDNIGMVFDSASKAFLLCYNRSPEAIKEKFPEAYDALQEQERKNVVF
ncbi:hypothetical protein SLOPH_1209 [Spraguea lophii 42_110]|uniref:Protein PNS1 n=1 Tax=Spraguea lophii (strain 42_110) TaxID=1358809 RepID=S7W4T7_SPRLO|nr:hypothetical protein SLOPH_1209 [Spraguea lophii 42_110]